MNSFARLLLPLLASAAMAAEVPPVRRIPPPGIALAEEDRAALQQGVAALGKDIELLRVELRERPALEALLPDVLIFHKAVDWALRHDEFFDPTQVAVAAKQLAIGMKRAEELRAGTPSWLAATGLVVRGYISKIDGSVQPYGMVVPDDWTAADKTPRRLDFWLRGRAEKSTELGFIEDRLKNRGEFAPLKALVLHPFGRYCCANRFAGEVDLFEALDHAKKTYPIDEERMTVRGFSMGGAAAWQYTTHHALRWAAAAPGAGFAETAEFFKVFAAGKEPPPWWEQVLWRWYDSTTMAANLVNVPTIAYSGETDGQKQAADIMLRFAEKEGLTFPHIIGPQTGHKYHPDSKPPIEEFVTAAAEKGRDPFPRHVRLTSYSLLHYRMDWLMLTALDREWERADLTGDVTDDGDMRITTSNVTGFSIEVPAGAKPAVRRVVVDGQTVAEADRCTFIALSKLDGKWSRLSDLAPDERPSGGKKVTQCGPIDHAFMKSFLFVKPTGTPLNAATGAWVDSELQHAITFWRQVFRGDVRVKDDIAITPDDMRQHHLVLWGDISSNAVLKQAAVKGLPLEWSAEKLRFGGVDYNPGHHMPILIYPNPLSSGQYLVLNSGPTFREQALLNNSDQTPKLPDWAIIDIRTPADAKWPGLVVNAGFFNRWWKLP